MASYGFIIPGGVPGSVFRALAAGAVVAVVSWGTTAHAKEPSLTAIELFDGASGPAYVQLADVLINGKAEMRLCPGAESGPMDKSVYGKLSKTALAVGGVLERGADGVLRYRLGDGLAQCVVPQNIKFEHNATFTAAQMADAADLRARAEGTGSDGGGAPQLIKNGVKLVFVTAPDAEQAEYLLAVRVGSIPGWKNYLAKYASATHTGEAKRTLAVLYVDAGEQALAAYQKSASYADLKNARTQMNLAHDTLPHSEGEIKLSSEIKAALGTLTAKASNELDAYNEALKSGKPGFAHLQNAKAVTDGIYEVDPDFLSVKQVQTAVTQAGTTFETAVRAAEAAQGSKQWDEAIKRIQPYRAFAGEQPRVAHVLDAAYAGYLLQGQQLEDSKDWPNAIASLENALNIKDTSEAREALKTAQNELKGDQDRTAANAALEKSKAYELQKEMISAYEVLTALPDGPRLIVKDEIARLTPDYVTAASQRAKDMQGAYPTINGIGEERGVEGAYALLERAYDLSADPAAKQDFDMRIQNLGEKLAAWFLDRAKHSLQKPAGSETELGWAYLKEAESYKAGNLEAVRDQMRMADPAHAMHSRLSIRVQFRDQTSQRQSEGFASQMESAIAAALDNSGMPVKVIRSSDTVREGVEPDFLIAGDVLDHHIAAPPTVESVESKYEASVHEVPNEEWNKLNRQVDSAAEQLRTAQAILQGVKAKGKKKEIEDAERQVAEAQKNVDDMRARLDSIPRSKTEPVIRSYSYKKTTYDVQNRVLLQFRIDDLFTGRKGEPVQVQLQDAKKFVTLTDVNPSDVNGVKSEYTLPDFPELLNQLDIKAREELIARVREKVSELPHTLYDVARQKEQDGYTEDAGELYMRYLNVAPAEQSEERDHAAKFLRDQFNFQSFPGAVKEPARRPPPLEPGMAQQAK
jgi:hypothetical protein